MSLYDELRARPGTVTRVGVAGLTSAATLAPDLYDIECFIDADWAAMIPSTQVTAEIQVSYDGLNFVPACSARWIAGRVVDAINATPPLGRSPCLGPMLGGTLGEEVRNDQMVDLRGVSYRTRVTASRPTDLAVKTLPTARLPRPPRSVHRSIVVEKSTTKFRATSNPPSAAGSFGTLPSSGNAVIVAGWAGDDDSALDWPVGACTDNQSNTYTEAVQSPVQNTVTTFYMTAAIWYAPVIGSPSGTFTVTIDPTGGGSFGGIVGVGLEISGLDATPLDKTASANGVDSADPFTANSGSTGVLAQADEIIIATFASNAVGSSDGVWTSITADQGTERAEELDNDTYQGGEADSLIVAATTAITITWTVVEAVQTQLDWTGCIASFKQAAAAGVTMPRRPQIIRQAVQRAATW